MSMMFCERHSVEYDSDVMEVCPYCKEEYDEDEAYDLDYELNKIFDEFEYGDNENDERRLEKLK